MSVIGERALCGTRGFKDPCYRTSSGWHSITVYRTIYSGINYTLQYSEATGLMPHFTIHCWYTLPRDFGRPTLESQSVLVTSRDFAGGRKMSLFVGLTRRLDPRFVKASILG